MNKHVAAGLMVAAVIAAGVFAGPKLLEAQQRNTSGPHVIVIKDVLHVLSPRLGGVKPIPPAAGVLKQIPLRHPMPLQSALAPSPMDSALQTSSGPLVSTTSGLNFLGLGIGQAGFNMQGAPPDTNGSAGATQYVQWVNLSFGIFSKSTGKIVYGPAEGNTLWQSLGGVCASNNSGDPIAQYDKQAQRWVLMQPVFTTPYALCVAVSTTSDATSAYNLYQFSIPSNYFPDYPKLAVWPDGYYVSYNAFTSASGGFVSGYACALDRANMLAGNAATMQCFNGGGYPSLLPSDLDGDSGAPGTTAAPPAGSPNYFIDFSSTNSLNLFKFHVDWTTPSNSTFTGPAVIPVTSFSEACGGGTCVPQSSTTQQLDSLGDRLMYRFAYRNFGSYESLVISQSVNTGSGNTGVRWYEIRSPEANTAVYQQGTFAPDSNYRWMPSIAEDEKGDIALGYSLSGSTIFPAISFTGRVPTDALNTMETESSIIQGAGAQTGGLSRWGDYSNMSVDPADDCTFWYTTEFLKSSGSFNWSTEIASFTFPGCTTTTPDFSLSASPTSQTITAGSGTSYTIDVTPSNGYTGNVTLSVTTSLPAGMSVGFSPNPVGINSNTAGSSTLSVNTATSTPSGTYNLTVSGTDGTLTNTTQVTVVVQPPPTPDFSLSSSPGSATVTQGSNATYTIAVTPSGGYTGTVNLSTGTLPTGVTASFNPSAVSTTGSVVDSTLTLATAGNAPTGTYNITVTGTDSSGSPTHSIQVGLTIQQVTSSDFAISATPSSAAAQPGSSTSYTVSIAGSATGPFNGTVNLSVTGVPPRTSTSFNPTSITGSGSSTLTVSPNKRATKGTYTLTITGTSGSLTHSVNVTFVIGTISTPDFSLSASPSSQTVTPGTGTSYTVNMTPTNGYSNTVNLSIGTLPSGVTATFNPPSVSASSTSSTLSITTSTSTPAGTYTLTITGTDGTLTHTTSAALVVQSSGGGGNFSLSASPNTLTMTAKSTGSSTITVTPSGGFTGTVNLSISSLPRGVSASFSPSSVTGSGSSTLTISTAGRPQTGAFTLTITGTSGSITQTTTLTLTIN
ncbi:MAG: hypothetical protein KGL59_06005 [Acidobacteriota bacterium]|nr:hypothetical protein [Acidobacteriota bacterium]